MSRRRAAEKRTILPDHKFKDLVLAKFMNRIMRDGKKSVAEKIVYGAFDIIAKKTEKEERHASFRPPLCLVVVYVVVRAALLLLLLFFLLSYRKSSSFFACARACACEEIV